MKYLIKNKYWKLNEEYDINKILYLLIDRPDENYNKEFVWYLNCKNKNDIYYYCKAHREYDLPAYVYNDCCINWFVNNNKHREKSKPASIIENSKEYWVNGHKIKNKTNN